MDSKEKELKAKPKRVSRFARKMAKKRSNLDRRLSKMKSKLRDVENRKEALTSKNGDKKADRSESVENLDTRSESAIKTGGTPINEKQQVSIDKLEINESEQSAKVDIPDKKEGSDSKDSSHESEHKSGQELSRKSHQKRESKRISETSNASTDEADLPVKKRSSSQQHDKKSSLKSHENKHSTDRASSRQEQIKMKDLAKPEGSMAPKPSPSLTPKRKSAGFGGLGGALGARGGKKVKASVLLRKIIDRLDESNELKFVSPYQNEFLRLLRGLHCHKIRVTWLSNHGPELDKGSALQLSLSDQDRHSDDSNADNTGKGFRHILNSEIVGSLHALSWETLMGLSPAETGSIRQFTDIHVIQTLPVEDRHNQFLPMLERLSRESGSLLLAPMSLRSEIEQLQYQLEINRGYSVIDPERFTYVDTALGQNNINWLDEMLAVEGAAESIKEFSLHRHIKRIAQTLEAACGRELSKLELVEELKSLQPTKTVNSISVTELEALMKSTVSSTKLLLGAKGIQMDELGQISFASGFNELESAQALVSELSTDVMVREDELDVLKFGKDQRKSIDRIKRFRFASKLGFLWKLKPEYIEHLHHGTSDVILEHAKHLYKQTSSIVEKHLKQMSGFADALQKNSDELNSFKRFITTWRSERHLTEAISKISDLNHFRSSVFSKKGNAAPVEAQSGVLKELRESRMFVSQLMAFGMLGAVLLGSTYAVDVFVVWVTGEAIDLGESLIQAAKSSRGLGRQVRILIAGVAGICIVFYLLLRLYLRGSEKVLDQQRIADVYALQLEDVVAKFISESSAVTKEIIAADLDQLQLRFEEFRSALPESLKSPGRGKERSGLGSTSIGQAEPVKRIETLRKWLNSVLSERDSISIVQTQKAAFDEAQQHFKT